jgi:hypothetical protein
MTTQLSTPKFASYSENVQIVYKLYEARARGDEEAVFCILDPTVTLEVMENFPYGGIYYGYEGMNEFFANLLQDFGDWCAKPEELLDAGEHVVSLGHYHGVVKKTGIKVKVCFAHIITVHDGKVVRMRQYTDTLKVARALGNEN